MTNLGVLGNAAASHGDAYLWKVEMMQVPLRAGYQQCAAHLEVSPEICISCAYPSGQDDRSKMCLNCQAGRNMYHKDVL